jgi:hypothetical protein
MESLQRHFPLDALAEVLEVSASGFALHRRKPQRPRRRQDQQLAVLIGQSFAQSRQTYGCLRVQADLRALGQRCG